ncbi:N(6)-adenine-specific methyltransferase METTL4-like isoform X2 [Gigantopelta aegis]|uniref:N(6)-adenine-specific methyltransferase METTL4-like isoform X2 n=1 Tax=Gigantopelta aegis TaxID=1735272 RepID=UPI001B88CC85|nr:N(6)-adenine-specific methyltransferase METTL4-like isoform X2 [Gigantopelta aegis]
MVTMSVICENQHGWVIDHLASISKVYKKTKCYIDVNCLKSKFVTECPPDGLKFNHGSEDMDGNNSLLMSFTDTETPKQVTADVTSLQDLHMTSNKAEPSTLSYAFKSDLFAIHQTYMMDTQFEKIQQQMAVDSNRHVLPVKRKRKRQSVQHQILCGNDNIKAVCGRLKLALNSLVEVAQCHGHLVHVGKLPPDNNLRARSAAHIRLYDNSMAELCEDWKNSIYQRKSLIVEDSGCYNGLDIVNRKVENNKECVVTRVMGELYLIPASCNFMLSSMSYLLHNSELLTVDGGYDLIVIDPPWQNKSVKRKKSYCVLSEEEIGTLPVPKLAAPGCLVVIWATNKSRILQFITKLLPLWNIQQFVTWYWLKVTTCGVPISSIDSTQKQPYEMLVMGRTACESPSELLSLYLPENPKCLELFARNLWPGWTSWGNEVLRHQHINFYTQITTDDKRPANSDVEEAVVK